MNVPQIIVLAAFLIMTVVGYIVMSADKKKAQSKEWRTPEKTLFLVAFLLGGIGTTIAMFKCRHKTKHWYFKYGMPLLAVLNVAVVAVLLYILA